MISFVGDTSASGTQSSEMISLGNHLTNTSAPALVTRRPAACPRNATVPRRALATLPAMISLCCSPSITPMSKKSNRRADHGWRRYRSFLLVLRRTLGCGRSEERLPELMLSVLLKWLLTCFSSANCDPKRMPQPATIHLCGLEPPCESTCRSNHRRLQDSLLCTLHPSQRHANGPLWLLTC